MPFEELSTTQKDRLARTVEPALDVMPGLGAFFRDDFLQKMNWVAALFEGDFRDDHGRVSSGLSRHGISTVACGGLADYMNEWYSLSSDHSDLMVVRNRYHEPSYFITDDLATFCIISDSDYFWGIAASPNDLGQIIGRNVVDSLTEFENDIAPLLDSSDAHNLRIGSMLQQYLHTCLKSIERMGRSP